MKEAMIFSGKGPILKGYPFWDCVPGKYGPGLPIHIVPVLLVHVFSQTIHVSTRQSDGELQELISKQQGPDAGVKPRHGWKTQGRVGKWSGGDATA